MPLISFIVLYHNEPVEMLQECLGSIIRCVGTTDFEIVVIDDGSDVSPSAVIASFEAPIKLVREDASGAPVARNNGIRQARGRYLQFVDADDALLPTYAEVVKIVVSANSVESSAAPDVVMFRFSRSADAVPVAGEVKQLTVWSGSGTQYLQTHNLRSGACGYLFRRDMVGSLTFCPYIYLEDELFTPQLLLRAARLIDVDVVCYHYRQRAGSLTSKAPPSKRRKRFDDHLFILQQLYALHDTRLSRRIAQLTMDLLYNVVRQTRSPREFLRYRCRLIEAGLYPLPLLRYTTKYYLFALLSHLL